MRLVAALVVLAGAVGCTEATVVRVVDGREIVGQFVSARAYAMYARGAEAEARGDWANARLAYLSAAEEEGANAEVWTRVGAVSCRLGRPDDAQGAFERAAEAAPEYEPVFRERATCALAQGPLAPEVAKSTFDDAARALALDPESEETVLLYARAAEKAGDLVRAERALRELVARSPRRAPGWQALLDFAKRHDDDDAAVRAAGALEGLGVVAQPSSGALAAGTAPAVTAGPTPANGDAAAGKELDEVDAALARDALDEARLLAKRAHVAPAELAVRAAALGRAAVARVQAELVFRADPSNASAAIALAVAADLLGDEGGVVKALTSAGALTTPPSPLARLLFAELVQRRTDRDAARTFLGPVAPPPAGADALLRTTHTRVAARLQAND